MSQYPPPYPPPGQQPPQYPYNFDYYQPQAADPLGPARRASVMMYVLGALVGVSGLCCAGVGAMFTQMVAQQPELLSEISAAAPGVQPELLQVVFIVAGAIVLLVGIGMMVLGYFVRGGGMGSVITAIVVAAIAILYLVVNLVAILSGAGGAGANNPAQLGLSACFALVPLSLFGLLMAWLIQAARNAGEVRAMKQQYQAQMWQYTQQQQAYGQGGYGAAPPSGYAPPPPAPGMGYGAPPPAPPPRTSNTSSTSWPPPPPRGVAGEDEDDDASAGR